MTTLELLAAIDNPDWWALVETIRQAPDNHLAQLVAADWLEDRGGDVWAHLIRYAVNHNEFPFPEYLCWVAEREFHKGGFYQRRHGTSLHQDFVKQQRLVNQASAVCIRLFYEHQRLTDMWGFSGEVFRLSGGNGPLFTQVAIPFDRWCSTAATLGWGPFFARRFPITGVQVWGNIRPNLISEEGGPWYVWERARWGDEYFGANIRDRTLGVPAIFGSSVGNQLPTRLFDQLAAQVVKMKCDVKMLTGFTPSIPGKPRHPGSNVHQIRFRNPEEAEAAFQAALIADALAEPDTTVRILPPVRLP